MLTNKSYLIYLLLLIFAVFSLYSNFRNYQAYNNQKYVYDAVSSGAYQDIPADFITKITRGYPNLSATAIPFNTIIGAYWINNDSLELGFEFLRKGNIDNPYLGFSDMIFANVYLGLGIKDSLKYYSNEASRKLPNNPSHFALQGKIYLEEKKLDSFVNRFNEITSRVPDKGVWRLYLSAMVKEKYNLDTTEVNQNAEKAKSIFKDDRLINLTADYVLYGVDNVKRSLVLNKTAIDSFNTNPLYSEKVIQEAIDLVPSNITNYETLIEILFRQNKFSEVIDLYTVLNEKNMTQINGTMVEFISISYLNLKDFNKGCYLAKALNDAGYSSSVDVINKCRSVF